MDAASGVGGIALRCRARVGGLAALPVVAAVTSVHGQWSVVNLHPAGATESAAYGVGGGRQVGWAEVGGVTVDYRRASLWSGTAASWVDLNPAGALHSAAYSTTGNEQSGSAVFLISSAEDTHAGLWHGTAASWTDLHPSFAIRSSIAYATTGTRQAGVAQVGQSNHASVWSGSAGTCVDLHPGPVGRSEAFAAAGDQQFGYVNSAEPGSDYFHATMWTGTAASRVDLHPAWAGADQSFVWTVGGGQQGGNVVFFGPPYARHGGTWTGTAASWVDLHPMGVEETELLSTYGGYQAGTAYSGGVSHACMWRGTPASWVDLHAFLPPDFSSDSQARGIWNDGAFTYVVGQGYNSTTARDEALMWVGPGPCYPDCNADGSLTVADFGCFQTKFVVQDPYADCNGDGARTVADFGCFQTRFVQGCP